MDITISILANHHKRNWNGKKCTLFFQIKKLGSTAAEHDQLPQHGMVIIMTSWKQIPVNQGLSKYVHSLLFLLISKIFSWNRRKTAMSYPLTTFPERVCDFCSLLPQRSSPCSSLLILRDLKIRWLWPIIFPT